MQPTDDDTDRHAAIRLQYLSPTFVRYLDLRAGEHVRRGVGEHVEVAFCIDGRGHITGALKWINSVLPDQWRATMRRWSGQKKVP